jgi:hypothetical protein
MSAILESELFWLYSYIVAFLILLKLEVDLLFLSSDISSSNSS